MTEEWWIEGLVVRGFPPSGPGSEKPMGFHVEIGRQWVDPANPDAMPRREVSLPMSIEDAEKIGFALPKFLAELNAEAVEAVVKLELQMQAAEQEIAGLSAKVQELTQASDDARKQADRMSGAAVAAQAEIERYKAASDVIEMMRKDEQIAAMSGQIMSLTQKLQVATAAADQNLAIARKLAEKIKASD